MPGIQFLVQLHLEGDAPRSAIDTLLGIARTVARSSRGVVVNQQEGTIETPRGVRRLAPASKSSAVALLQVSWFTMDSERLAASAPAQLLDTIEGALPEVLPRRYGLFEPPQFKLEVEGLDHFRTFLAKHLRETVVWYCHQPCRGVYVAVPDRVGPTPRGFRCNRLTLDINAAVMMDPAWRMELVRLWLAVADLIRAFYAEIRVGVCPTKAWWWNGIPTGTPSAVLIGPPYLDLWTTFTQRARTSAGGLAYWERMNEASVAENGHIPVAPEALVQPPDHRTEIDPSTGELLSVFTYNDIQYPRIWPFDGPKI
jgi:hypothetical protein